MNPLRRRWTESEIIILRDHYLSLSDSEIATRLGKEFNRNIGPGSVYKKRKSLGLFKNLEMSNRRFLVRCNNCGKDFSSPSPNIAQYCSEACKQDFYRKKWRTPIQIKINTETSKESEKMVIPILQQLKFEDIVWCRKFSNSFPFDYLARKDGMLCTIEVTVAAARKLHKAAQEFSNYIHSETYVCHIAPESRKVVVNKLLIGRWFSSVFKGRHGLHKRSYEENFVTVYEGLLPSI